MAVPQGKTVLDSGVLHFIGSEWVTAGESPAILFGRNSTGNQLDATRENYGLSVGINLEPGQEYAGQVPFVFDEKQYRLIFVFYRVAEIQAGPLFQVTFTLTQEG